MSDGPSLVTRPGSRNWYIRGTDSGGRPVFKSTKTADRATAEAILTQYKARLLTELVHGKVATTTFHEAAEAYINSGGQKLFLFRERADGSITGLIPHFGDTPLRKISQDDLDKAAAALCEPGASRETLIRNVYTPFIAVWNYASSASRKWAEPRKWERPKKVKGTGARSSASRAGTQPVTYDRAWAFVSAMSPAPACLMTALFYGGARPIEYFALEAPEVDIDGRWITILFTKTGEPRGVPMHEMLVPMFTALKAAALARDCRRIFLNRHGEPYQITDSEEGINGQMKGAIKGARRRLRKAGTPVDDVSPYTARHTVSTQLVVNGVHPHIKDQILGHAADNMSRHYTHVPQPPLIDAINTLPVIPAWRDAAWLNDPVTWQAKLVRWEKTGRRAASNEDREAA